MLYTFSTPQPPSYFVVYGPDDLQGEFIDSMILVQCIDPPTHRTGTIKLVNLTSLMLLINRNFYINHGQNPVNTQFCA